MRISLLEKDPATGSQWCTNMEILQSRSNPKLFHKLHIQAISES